MNADSRDAAILDGSVADRAPPPGAAGLPGTGAAVVTDPDEQPAIDPWFRPGPEGDGVAFGRGPTRVAGPRGPGEARAYGVPGVVPLCRSLPGPAVTGS